jgi:hypothetical protein
MHTIDLHAHTTASDGSLTPTELVDQAARMGLTALGVTDHDTLDGLAEAMEAARERGIELVPGIELSISVPVGRFHMLGYLIDHEDPTLSERLWRLKDNRARRNERMLDKMLQLGVPITREEVAAESGGGQIGRPHMALVLFKKGIVSSTQEAFDRYLADGAAAHVPKDKITMQEGLDLIRGAGGIAVMAHPIQRLLDDDALMTELRRLRAMGLDGMECYYSQHTPERTQVYLEMARRAGLLVTGGSDFHGASKPDVYLGRVYQGQPVSAELLESMKEYKKERLGC